MLLRRGPRSGESRVATDAVFEPPLTLSVVGIGCSFEPLVHVGFRRRVEFLAGFAGGGELLHDRAVCESAGRRGKSRVFPGFRRDLRALACWTAAREGADISTKEEQCTRS